MDNLIRTITNNPALALVIIGAIFFIMLLGASLGNSNKRKKYRNNSNYRNNSSYNRNYERNYNDNRRDNNLQHNSQSGQLLSFNERTIPETTALSIVSNSHYSKRPLMNRSEYKLFRKLENYLEKLPQGKRVRLFSQVAMGEFISSESDEAFRLVNGKRVDFVIVDFSGEAIIVIEYQGAGHYQENAIERDAIKREACRKAGIEFLEFKKNYDDLDFQRVSRVLNAHFARKHAKHIEHSQKRSEPPKLNIS